MNAKGDQLQLQVTRSFDLVTLQDIKAFQYINSLEEDSIAEPKTCGKLGIE